MNEENISPNLAPEERKIVIAAADPNGLIGLMQKKQVESALIDITSKAISDLGHLDRYTEDTIKIFTSSFSDELKNDFKGMTMELVGLAIYHGIREESKTPKTINNAAWHWYCKRFLQSDLYKNAVYKQNTFLKQNQSKGPMKESQRQRLLYENILLKFQHYKRIKHFVDPGAVAYDYLAGLGLIKCTEEQREDFKTKAQEKLSKEEINKRLDGHSKESIEKALRIIEDKSSSVVVFEAKRLATANYFESLELCGMELEPLLKKALWPEKYK